MGGRFRALYRAVENDLGMSIAHKDAGLVRFRSADHSPAAGLRLHRPAVGGIESIRVLVPPRRAKRLDVAAGVSHSARNALGSQLPADLHQRVQRLSDRTARGAHLVRPGDAECGAEIRQPWHIHRAALREQPLRAVGGLLSLRVCEPVGRGDSIATSIRLPSAQCA